MFVHCFVLSNNIYKWNYTLFVFLWCVSLSIMPSRSLHVVTSGKISFLFYGWKIFNSLCVFFLSIYLWMDTWLASISWLFSTLKWTWGCTYLFQSVFSFSSDEYPGVELLDCTVFLFLIFWETLILLSRVAVPAYITSVHEGSLLLTSWPKLVTCHLFDNSHCDRCKIIFHVVLICIFMMINDVEHLFRYMLSICRSSLKNIFMQVIYPGFQSSCFLMLTCMSYLYIWILTPYQHIFDIKPNQYHF